MRHAVKVRIYPTNEQAESLSKAFGCARWFWNNSLAETNQLYKETGKGLSRQKMNARLPGLKKEFEWLAEPYSQVLQSASLNLSRAFINFFEGRASFPKFKSKHGKQSIQYPQDVKITDKGLKIPKVGIVSAKINRTFDGKLKTVTVSLAPSGKYFASLLFDDGLPDKEKTVDGKAVGIDLGLTHFAITSDGSKFDNPRVLKSILATSNGSSRNYRVSRKAQIDGRKRGV
jgi:putative transposase